MTIHEIFRALRQAGLTLAREQWMLAALLRCRAEVTSEFLSLATGARREACTNAGARLVTSGLATVRQAKKGKEHRINVWAGTPALTKLLTEDDAMRFGQYVYNTKALANCEAETIPAIADLEAPSAEELAAALDSHPSAIFKWRVPPLAKQGFIEISGTKPQRFKLTKKGVRLLN